MTVPEVSSMGPEKSKAVQPITRESEMYQAEEITGCLLAVFVLAPNPTRKWTQGTKIQPDFEHCCEFFSGFYVN